MKRSYKRTNGRTRTRADETTTDRGETAWALPTATGDVSQSVRHTDDDERKKRRKGSYSSVLQWSQAAGNVARPPASDQRPMEPSPAVERGLMAAAAATTTTERREDGRPLAEGGRADTDRRKDFERACAIRARRP